MGDKDQGDIEMDKNASNLQVDLWRKIDHRNEVRCHLSARQVSDSLADHRSSDRFSVDLIQGKKIDKKDIAK